MIDELTKIAERIVNSMREELETKDINACGNLSDSIKFNVSQHFIEISFNKYGAYVDSGTGPRATGGEGSGFLDKIKRWTKCRGIPEEAAYPIMMNIIKHGTKPKPWLGSFKKHIMDLDKDLLEYIGIRVENDFERMFKQIWS